MADILIRGFEPRKDLKEVQMLVGMSAMEQLAIANRQAYAHPLALSLWLGFASILIQVLHLWPNGSGPNGWLGYLAPLPILACTAVPVMFGIDWVHRPHFEKLLRIKVKSLTTALPNPIVSNTNSKSPKSPKPHFLVMEYKNTPIGYVMFQPCTKGNQYRMTHFHVDSPYRRAGVGYDLLLRGVEDLKDADVLGVTTGLTPYVTECLQSVGFKVNQEALITWDEHKDQDADLDKEPILWVNNQKTGWRLTRS